MTDPPYVSDVPRTQAQIARDGFVKGAPGIVQGGQQTRPVRTGGNQSLGKPTALSGFDIDPVVIGHDATSAGAHGTSVGPAAVVGGSGGTAVGYTAEADGNNSFAGGPATASGNNSTALQGLASGDGSTAVGATSSGATAHATETNSLALGGGAHAGGAGSVAIGTDSGGAGPVTSTDNEFLLGTLNHIVIVDGKLVIADSGGGRWQIVVSTGGALSTVAYP